MLSIIYDLEMTVNRKKGTFAEIIEIGAIKVDEQNGNHIIVDTFQSFVKPTFSPTLTEDTIQFTGITQENIAHALTLQYALDRFMTWINSDHYALCSWGPDDKCQLVKECGQKSISLHWLHHHNNLQQQVSRVLKREKNQQIGLKAALELVGVPFIGHQHCALDDAYNTALVYIHMHKHIKIVCNK